MRHAAGLLAAERQELSWDVWFDELRKLRERLLPAQIASSRGITVGRPACSILISVPTETDFRVSGRGVRQALDRVLGGRPGSHFGEGGARSASHSGLRSARSQGVRRQFICNKIPNDPLDLLRSPKFVRRTALETLRSRHPHSSHPRHGASEARHWRSCLISRRGRSLDYRPATRKPPSAPSSSAFRHCRRDAPPKCRERPSGSSPA